MLGFFRRLAHWEGISLLVLLFIAMPLKYMWEMPEYVRVVGMVHGVLFIAFVIVAILVTKQEKWNLSKFIFCFIASFIPFGTFYLDAKLLKKQEQKKVV